VVMSHLSSWTKIESREVSIIPQLDWFHLHWICFGGKGIVDMYHRDGESIMMRLLHWLCERTTCTLNCDVIHQMDVDTAFLNAELEESYITQPEGFYMV